MTDKEKKARLIIDSLPFDDPSNFTTFINMGNFCNNMNDLVYLEIDYMSPLTLSSSQTTGTAAGGNLKVLNVYDAVEVLINFPQQDSYDTATGTNTYHICFLELEGGTQTTAYTNREDMLHDPTMWQKWKFNQKPSQIVMRPEVFQQKSAQVQLKFISSPGTIFSHSATPDELQYQYISDFKLVMTITK